jgi:hypothetical protein
MLKKTEYFSSAIHGVNDLDHAILQATKKRDTFLGSQKDAIDSIDEEDIKIAPFSNQTVAVVIKLTYYPKFIQQ